MKNSEQCTSLPEQVVESSQTSFWDTDPSLLSNGTNTLAKSSEQEQQMDGLTECQSGKETLENLIHPNTKDEWIAFMQDSLVRMFQQQEVRQALEKTQGLDFTEKSYALQTYYNLDTSSWKTWQTSLMETTDQCYELLLETLPRAGTIVSGVVYPLPKLEQTINAIDGGYLHTPTATANQMSLSMVRRSGWWPTPTAHNGQERGFPAEFRRNSCLTADAIRAEVMEGKMKMWPTPNASDNRDRGNLNTPSVQRRIEKGKQISLSMEAGGKLNPVWVEWLMGWPLHHTDLKR